jgi:hypothetical protein
VEVLSKALTAKWFAAKSEGQNAKAKARNNALRP